MATCSSVEQANVEVASLVALALDTQRVPVLQEFWVIPEGTHQLYLALVTPLVDQLGLHDTYRLILEALGKETFVSRDFVSSRLIVLGESQSRALVDRIEAGAISVARVGSHENVEVFPVPPASTIQKSGFLNFVPTATGQETPCQVLFGAFGSGGFIKPRTLENRAQLDELFQLLNILEKDREQIVNDLSHARGTQTMVYNVGLDILYKSGLV